MRKNFPYPKTPDEAREKLLAQTRKEGACLIWTGRMQARGYGYFHYPPAHSQDAHRVIYFLEHGPIERGMHVRHLCHNRACVNPKHLEIGTAKQNAADHKRAVVEGVTYTKNVGRPTPEIEAQMLEDVEKHDFRMIDLADKYGYNVLTCGKIIRRLKEERGPTAAEKLKLLKDAYKAGLIPGDVFEQKYLELTEQLREGQK